MTAVLDIEATMMDEQAGQAMKKDCEKSREEACEVEDSESENDESQSCMNLSKNHVVGAQQVQQQLVCTHYHDLHIQRVFGPLHLQ